MYKSIIDAVTKQYVRSKQRLKFCEDDIARLMEDLRIAVINKTSIEEEVSEYTTFLVENGVDLDSIKEEIR